MRVMGRLRGGLYRQLVLRAHLHRLASPHDGDGQVRWTESDTYAHAVEAFMADRVNQPEVADAAR